MDEDTISRRKTLATAGTLFGTVASGCASLTSLADEPQRNVLFQEYLSEPIVEGAPSVHEGPGWYATLIQGESQARKLVNWDVLETEQEGWATLFRETDYDSEVVGILVSRYDLADFDHDVPQLRFDGDVATYRIDGDSWPRRARIRPSSDAPLALYTQIERWRRNGHRRIARTEIQLTTAWEDDQAAR